MVFVFAVMIIRIAPGPNVFATLIAGIAMYLWGPFLGRLIFHGFVVIVGVQ